MSRQTMFITAHHIIENLATSLYDSYGQAVMELVRNGVVASMPDPKRWEPKLARIEISLVPNHPLGRRGSGALMVLDHGSGLTDAGIESFFSLGKSIGYIKKNAKGTHGGASQKGIGRMAALTLNRSCTEDDEEISERIKHGFYILSRTSESGEVRFMRFTPEDVELGSLEKNRFISANAAEMGPIKSLHGSFTAIVIPTPVFSTHDQIFEAIKWLLPREQDKMFSLTIGGKPAIPPPLQDQLNHTSEDGRLRVRIGAWKPIQDPDRDGLWLCDSDTGFRVASCSKYGRKLPDPFWCPELTGEIFCPGLLESQNTSRSSLSKSFVSDKKGSPWQKLYMFLLREVAERAEQLLDRDPIDGDAAKALDEIAQLFGTRYGDPEDDVSILNPRPNGRTAGAKGSTERAKPDPDREIKKRARRHMTIKVRDQTYVLYHGMSLPPYVFAEVNSSNRYHIHVNVRGEYRALPKKREARTEHVLVQVLYAIGRSEYPQDPHAAVELANTLRSELMDAKKK